MRANGTDLPIHMTSHIRYLAVWVYIIGIYIGIPLKVGHVSIPAFWAGASGLLLLALNASQIQKQHGWLLLGLAGLALLGVVINYGDGAELARIKGAVQLLYSIVIAYGLFLELKGWGRERVAKLFWVIALLLVAGCALELFTVFKEWSDSFRNHVFEPGSLYNNDFRDKLVFGKIRPKLFTVEPSYVAIFLLLSMTAYFTLAKKTLTRSLQYFLIALAGMYLIGSPIVLLVVCVPVLNFLFLRKSWRGLAGAAFAGEAKRLLVVLLYSSALLMAMMFIWRDVGLNQKADAEGGRLGISQKTDVEGSRLTQIMHGKEDSFTGRLVAPPLIAYHVLTASPGFGVGLEAKEKLNEVVFHVFQHLEMQTNIVDTCKLGNYVTNNFWLHWIYWGLLGGLLMIVLVYKFMRLIGVRYPLYCFVVIAMFMQTMGGYVTPRFWFVSLLIMLLGTLHSATRDDSETMEYANDAQK